VKGSSQCLTEARRVAFIARAGGLAGNNFQLISTSPVTLNADSGQTFGGLNLKPLRVLSQRRTSLPSPIP
jgi:hypothetical protein